MKKYLVPIVIVVLVPLAAYLVMRGPGIWRGEPWYGWSAQSAWISSLESGNVNERQWAAEIIGIEKSYDAAVTIPALCKVLDSDEDEKVRYAAAEALRYIAERIGPEAKAAVPALQRGLSDSNWATNASCARSLAEIGPDAKEAVPGMLAALEKGRADGGQLHNSVKKLGAHAVPALALAITDQTEEGVAMIGPPRKRRAKLLAEIAQEIGPAAREAVPACQKALTDKNIRVRTHAATTLRFIGKDAESAIPALVLALRRDKELENQPDGFLWAYFREVGAALANIGPHSPEARSALREAADEQDHPGRTMIRDALRNIEERENRQN